MKNINQNVDKNLDNSKAQNSYLYHIAQDGWNDLQAYHIETANAWRVVALFAIVALIIVSGVAMYMVNQDKHKALIFERDSIGNLQALGLATKTLKIDNKIIAHQLANFIIAVREVPQDVTVKRRNINIVHKMADTKLRNFLDQMFVKRYAQAKDGGVLVGIDNIKPIEGGNSWEIRWHENPSTNILGMVVSYWSAIVTFKRLEVSDADVQLINPAGIFITYFNPVEDISDKALSLN